MKIVQRVVIIIMVLAFGVIPITGHAYSAQGSNPVAAPKTSIWSSFLPSFLISKPTQPSGYDQVVAAYTALEKSHGRIADENVLRKNLLTSQVFLSDAFRSSIEKPANERVRLKSENDLRALVDSMIPSDASAANIRDWVWLIMYDNTAMTLDRKSLTQSFTLPPATVEAGMNSYNSLLDTFKLAEEVAKDNIVKNGLRGGGVPPSAGGSSLPRGSSNTSAYWFGGCIGKVSGKLPPGAADKGGGKSNPAGMPSEPGSGGRSGPDGKPITGDQGIVGKTDCAAGDFTNGGQISDGGDATVWNGSNGNYKYTVNVLKWPPDQRNHPDTMIIIHVYKDGVEVGTKEITGKGADGDKKSDDITNNGTSVTVTNKDGTKEVVKVQSKDDAEKDEAAKEAKKEKDKPAPPKDKSSSPNPTDDSSPIGNPVVNCARAALKTAGDCALTALNDLYGPQMSNPKCESMTVTGMPDGGQVIHCGAGGKAEGFDLFQFTTQMGWTDPTPEDFSKLSQMLSVPTQDVQIINGLDTKQMNQDKPNAAGQFNMQNNSQQFQGNTPGNDPSFQGGDGSGGSRSNGKP